MSALAGLYVITDPVLTPPATLTRQVDAALRGGARIVQYRDKRGDAGLRLTQARALRTLCTQHDALLIINDDVELCLASDADGVHLGLEDTPLAEARKRLPGRVLGATCHGDPALAREAVAAGADYVAFGRFFASSTKPEAPQASLAAIEPHLAALAHPTVAIGGISLATAPALLAAGFDMLAVVGDVFGADDIEQHCRRYAMLFADAGISARG